MDSFQKIYRINTNGRRYQQKLKKKLKEWFPDQLLFLTAKPNTAEIAASVKNAFYQMIPVAETAKCLQEDISRYCEQLRQTSWPPMIDMFSTTEIEVPYLVTFSWRSFLKLKDIATVEVTVVMEVLLDEYINPFGMDLDKSKLGNLSSGAPVHDTVAETLLDVSDNGNIQAELFQK